MIHLNPCTKNYSLVSAGDFSKEGIQGRQKHLEAGGQGCFMQPAVVPQQNFPAPTEHPAAPRLRSGPTPRSLFSWILVLGPMELPRGLGGELAKHITIP